MSDEEREVEAQANAWRVYHVETGEALATHEDAGELAKHLGELKLGEAVIVRPVTVHKEG